jgi:hypothetical protein
VHRDRVAGQIEEQGGGPAQEQDPHQARGQRDLRLIDVGHARTGVEHGAEMIGLVVGVDHGHIAALEVEQPFEPGGQHRPDGLRLLALGEIREEVEQQGLTADIQPGQAGRGRLRSHAIRVVVRHP